MSSIPATRRADDRLPNAPVTQGTSDSSTNSGSTLQRTASVELPQFLPLTALYVGRFPSTNHSMVFLWVGGLIQGVRKAEKKLVLVVVQDENKPQPARTLQRYRWAMRNCPFFAPPLQSKAQRPFRGVCTFEIKLADIVGLDYWNPLLVDLSRMVIESQRITRRWFPSLERCSDHYSWRSSTKVEPTLQRTSSHPDVNVSVAVAKLLSELYKPSSGDGNSPPSLPQVMPQSEFLRGATSPTRRIHSYWSEGREERSYERLNRVFLTADRVLRVEDPSSEEPPAGRSRASSKSEDGASPVLAKQCSPDLDSVAGDEDEKQDHDMEANVQEMLYSQTVQFRFDDPFLPYVLREVVHDADHPHLLRLYEAGLPAWAIFMPMWTGLYRRWMRIFLAALILVISIVSMLLGFYDLYTRLPAVQNLLYRALGPLNGRFDMFFGSVQLSALFSWIAPYSSVLRRCWRAFKTLLELLQHLAVGAIWSVAVVLSWVWAELWPWIYALGQPLGTLACAGREAICSVFDCASWVLAGCRSTCWAVTHLAGNLFGGGGGAQLARETTSALLRAEFATVRRAFVTVYNCTLFLCAKFARHQASLSVTFARWRLSAYYALQKMLFRRPFLIGIISILFTLFVVDPMLPIFWSGSPVMPELLHPRLKRGNPGPVLLAIEKTLCRTADNLKAFGANGIRNGLLSMVTSFFSLGDNRDVSLLEVSLICSAAGVRNRGSFARSLSDQTCWHTSVGARRCHCPLKSIRGLNMTFSNGRDGARGKSVLGTRPLAIEVPPHRHANGSLTNLWTSCMRAPREMHTVAQSCLVSGSALRPFLHDGAAEFWAIKSHGIKVDSGSGMGRLFGYSQASEIGEALGGFVVEAPRGPAAKPPTNVSVCIATKQNAVDKKIAVGFPTCKNEALDGNHDEFDDSLVVGEVGRHSSIESVTIRASWTYSKSLLGACRFVGWDIALQEDDHHGGSHRHQLCSSRHLMATTCVGQLAPEITAVLRSAATVSASVALRCRDHRDAPAAVTKVQIAASKASSAMGVEWGSTSKLTGAMIRNICLHPSSLLSADSALRLPALERQWFAAAGAKTKGALPQKSFTPEVNDVDSIAGVAGTSFERGRGRGGAAVFASTWTGWHSLCCGLLVARLVGHALLSLAGKTSSFCSLRSACI